MTCIGYIRRVPIHTLHTYLDTYYIHIIYILYIYIYIYIYMYSIYIHTHTYNIYIYIYIYIYMNYIYITYLQYIWKHQYLKPPTVSTTSHCHLWVSPTTERFNTKPTTPRRVGLKPTTQVHSELAHLLGLNPQQQSTLGVRILRFDPWSCKHHSGFIHHLSIIYPSYPPLGFAEGSEGNRFPVDSPVLVDLPMGK